MSVYRSWSAGSLVGQRRDLVLELLLGRPARGRCFELAPPTTPAELASPVRIGRLGSEQAGEQMVDRRVGSWTGGRAPRSCPPSWHVTATSSAGRAWSGATCRGGAWVVVVVSTTGGVVVVSRERPPRDDRREHPPPPSYEPRSSGGKGPTRDRLGSRRRAPVALDPPRPAVRPTFRGYEPP